MPHSASPATLTVPIGPRALAALPRELVQVPVDLIDAMAGRLATLPPLPRDAQGYLVRSLAEPRVPDLAAAVPELLLHVRRHYPRYHTDLTLDLVAYWNRLARPLREQLKRQGRRVAAVSGGAVRVSRFRTPDNLARFHDQARRVSIRSYGERLTGAGLPDDDAFLTAMQAAAAADRVRAWLLTIAGEPAAYLYAEGRGRVLRYEHVAHDPAFADLAPDALLILEAMRDLMSGPPEQRRFERFDFVEREGPHKRGFATGAVPCVDVLLLRPSLSNRLTAGALGAFDQAVVRAKRVAAHPAVQGLAKRVRRG